MSAIDAKALEKKFDTTVALDKVSFSIEKGELFGFIGPTAAARRRSFASLCRC